MSALPLRFENKINKLDSGCWEWTGRKDSGGYCQSSTIGKDKRRCMAHRAVYEILVGPIPKGLELDHLCRNRACVNPEHLEPVTTRENVLRSQNLASINAKKTHCPQGHPYNQENTYIYPDGKRRCKICRMAASRKYRAMKGKQ
jgi:hypothetical protein